MPADLQFWHPSHLGVAKGKLLWRYVNTINTPVASSTWLGDGRAIADVYELVFTVAGASVTATVTALVAGTKNPYQNLSGASVVADGATPNLNLIPGVGLVISGSVATGWKARVAVGNYLEDNGTYETFFSYGVIQAGASSAGQRVAVVNVGGDTAMETALYSLPGLYWYGSSSELIVAKIAPHSSDARHRMADADNYTITFADWKTGLGGKKSADIYVNGVKAVDDALFDGATVYEYGSDNGYVDLADGLPGLQIVLCDTTADPTSVTVTLTVAPVDSYPWIYFASDTSGTPGTYSFQDLTLTEPGQVAGTITTGGIAYFWHKWVLPSAAVKGVLRQMLPRLRGLTV